MTAGGHSCNVSGNAKKKKKGWKGINKHVGPPGKKKKRNEGKKKEKISGPQHKKKRNFKKDLKIARKKEGLPKNAGEKTLAGEPPWKKKKCWGRRGAAVRKKWGQGTLEMHTVLTETRRNFFRREIGSPGAILHKRKSGGERKTKGRGKLLERKRGENSIETEENPGSKPDRREHGRPCKRRSTKGGKKPRFPGYK